MVTASDEAGARAIQLSIRTMPCAPSTVMRWPSFSTCVPTYVPTTQGYEAKIAEWMRRLRERPEDA